MITLIPIVSHADLIERIVGQFAFMIVMSEPDDHTYFELQELSVQDVFKKADAYFLDFTDELGFIYSEECSLQNKIAEFLKEWASVTDVTAIQQNVHYQLSVLDRE